MSSQDPAPPQPRRERRRSQRLHALASSAYTATAGHLEIDPEERDGRPQRRWFPAVAGAWLLGSVLVAMALGIAGWTVWGSRGGEEIPFGEPGENAAGGVGETPGPADADDGTGEGTPESGTDEGGEPAQGNPPTPTSPEGTGDSAAEETLIVVHVAGAVLEAGLVELPADARAGDAVEAAGGPAPEADLTRVNLARSLTDGEQLFLPRIGEESPELAQPEAATGDAGDPNGEAASSGSEAPVDLNSADAAALESLPGIGPARAQAIVEWREAHGGFSAAEDLLQISGIGPATFERLRPLVTV